MKKISLLTAMTVFLLLILSNALAFASDKEAQKIIIPEWVYLGVEIVPSIHNPNGNEVIYGFDKASARVGKSNGDFEFILVKQTRSKNEIELRKIRLAKNKTYYRELQCIGLYLDGSIKFAKRLDGGVHKPIEGIAEKFATAFAIWKNSAETGQQIIEMPELLDGLNKFEIVTGKQGFENWACFIDGRQTGLDKADDKLLNIVSYAFNPDERLYSKEVTTCARTGPTSYNVVSGAGSLYTYEDKLLREDKQRNVTSVDAKVLDREARFYYKFYQYERK